MKDKKHIKTDILEAIFTSLSTIQSGTEMEFYYKSTSTRR